MNGDSGTPPEVQRVERTGLALVHEGERIIAADEALAALTPAGGAIVNYYFPVEVEIIGAGTADALAEQIYAALQQELDALG
jgi:hypothetical protein